MFSWKYESRDFKMNWTPWYLFAQSIFTPPDEALRRATLLDERERERARESIIAAASLPSPTERLHDLMTELWNVSLGDMPTALRHADRIKDRAVRIEFSRHYGLQHREEYLRERRPAQAAIAI